MEGMECLEVKRLRTFNTSHGGVRPQSIGEALYRYGEYLSINIRKVG